MVDSHLSPPTAPGGPSHPLHGQARHQLLETLPGRGLHFSMNTKPPNNQKTLFWYRYYYVLLCITLLPSLILLTQKSLQSKTSTLTSQALVTHLMRDCPLKHCSPVADAPQFLSATSVPPRSPSAVHPSSLRTNIGKIPWMPADFGTVWWVWNVWNCRGVARRLIEDILNDFKDYDC